MPSRPARSRGYVSLRLMALAAAVLAALSLPGLGFVAMAGESEDRLRGLAERGDWRDIIASAPGLLPAAPDPTDATLLRRLDLLAYAYLQTGQDDQVVAILSSFKARNLPADLPAAAELVLAALPVRYALERDAWSEAAALPSDERRIPQARAVVSFGRALGAARDGRPQAARADIARLAAAAKQLTDEGDPASAAEVAVQIGAARAWVDLAEGHPAEGVQEMRAAADSEDAQGARGLEPRVVPMRELLADLLAETDAPAAALKEYEASLARAPGRLRSYWGAGQAADEAGMRATAKVYYGKFTEACRFATCRRPGLLTATKRK
jgi:hypothetical protein